MVASSVKMPPMFDHIAWIHGIRYGWLLVHNLVSKVFVTLVQRNEQQTILSVDQKDPSLWKREW